MIWIRVKYQGENRRHEAVCAMDAMLPTQHNAPHSKARIESSITESTIDNYHSGVVLHIAPCVIETKYS